jgi:hypothetical protein
VNWKKGKEGFIEEEWPYLALSRSNGAHTAGQGGTAWLLQAYSAKRPRTQRQTAGADQIFQLQWGFHNQAQHSGRLLDKSFPLANAYWSAESSPHFSLFIFLLFSNFFASNFLII